MTGFIIGIGLAFALGLYIVSQISTHIDRKTRRNKLIQNMEEFDKKHKE
jgi:hypothetical protein